MLTVNLRISRNQRQNPELIPAWTAMGLYGCSSVLTRLTPEKFEDTCQLHCNHDLHDDEIQMRNSSDNANLFSTIWGLYMKYYFDEFDYEENDSFAVDFNGDDNIDNFVQLKVKGVKECLTVHQNEFEEVDSFSCFLEDGSLLEEKILRAEISDIDLELLVQVRKIGNHSETLPVHIYGKKAIISHNSLDF